MDTICSVGTNNDVTPNTYIFMYALFEEDNDGNADTFSNGLTFYRGNNSLCHNNGAGDNLTAGVYEYRYAFHNNNHFQDRAGYLATIWVQDDVPKWVDAGPLTDDEPVGSWYEFAIADHDAYNHGVDDDHEYDIFYEYTSIVATGGGCAGQCGWLTIHEHNNTINGEIPTAFDTNNC